MNNTVTTDERQDEVSKSENSSKPLWDVGEENQKILTGCYLALGLLICYVLKNFFQFTFTFIFDRFMTTSAFALMMERSPDMPALGLAAVLTVGLGLWVRYTLKTNTFGLEVVAEMKKVTWSPWNVTWKSTIAVIITVSICAVILGLFDMMWGGLASYLLR